MIKIVTNAQVSLLVKHAVNFTFWIVIIIAYHIEEIVYLTQLKVVCVKAVIMDTELFKVPVYLVWHKEMVILIVIMIVILLNIKEMVIN